MMMKHFFEKTSLWVVAFFLFSTTISAQEPQGAVITPDFFPAKSYWVNTEFGVYMENMKEKVALVVVTDENCIECGYFIHMLKDKIAKSAGIQLLQVMKADTASPVSRNHLLQYIQKNGYVHPIGVLPDLSGFKNAKIERAPYFLLYEKSAVPSVMGGGQDGFAAVSKRIDFLLEDQTLLRTCMAHQLRSVIEPGWWANPLIETPTYIAAEEGGDKLFINDAAHNRLLVLDGEGNCNLMLGSMIPGYADESMYTSSFRKPHGIVHSDNKLFIADTYNNRVRVVDFATEKVSSLVGNGFISWKRGKEIDSKYEPLGLPVDVAVLGNQLYVASASTNQIFEVDMKDGAARLLCDLPENTYGILRNCPVNLNAGSNVLYVTMADGQAFIIDKKGKLEPVDKKSLYRFKSVTAWKNGVAGITTDGMLVYQQEGKWRVVGENDGKDKNNNAVKLNHPTDALNLNGDLLVTDTDNHRIKEIGSPDDKMMRNFWYKVSMEMIGFETAHTGGDIVLMDTIFVGKKDVTMNVILDLEGYKLLEGGQNEGVVHGTTGTASLVSDQLKDESFTIKMKSEYPEEELYMELYLTLEHPEDPGLYIVKRAYLDFPVFKMEKADEVQEQIFRPNLLPY